MKNVLAVVVALPMCIGCVKSEGAMLREDVTAVRHARAPDRLVERGRAFSSVGDLTRAEQYFSAALDAGADERVVLPFLLEVYIRDHRYRDAIQCAETHLRRHPTQQKTRLLLATLEAALGYSNQAEEHLRAVVAGEPDNADAHFALAVLYQRDLGRPARADEHFREYLRIEPTGPHSEEARGSLLTVIR